MARRSLAPTSAAILLSSFPSGELQVAIRQKDGEEMSGLGSGKNVTFPVKLRMSLTGGVLSVDWAKPNDEWQSLQKVTLQFQPAFAGVVALSHDNRQLAKANYSNLSLKRN
jgi:hypothetical protein